MLTTILTLLGRSILPAALTTLVGNNAPAAVIDAVPVDSIPLTGDWRIDAAAVAAVVARIVYLKVRDRYKPPEAPPATAGKA